MAVAVVAEPPEVPHDKTLSYDERVTVGPFRDWLITELTRLRIWDADAAKCRHRSVEESDYPSFRRLCARWGVRDRALQEVLAGRVTRVHYTLPDQVFSRDGTPRLLEDLYATELDEILGCGTCRACCAGRPHGHDERGRPAHRGYRGPITASRCPAVQKRHDGKGTT